MESVFDENDEQAPAASLQDENGTWLRRENWYEDKMHEHFDNCRSSRFGLEEGYHDMVMYFALVLE